MRQKTMKLSKLLLTASLAFAAVAASAQVTYTFSGLSSIFEPNASNVLQTFTLTVPGFITVDTVFAASDLTASFSAQESVTGVEFYLVDPFNPGGTSAVVNVQTASTGTFYFFDQGAYSNPGANATNASFHPATLTVTPVPEPASFVALAAGGAALLRRRRRRF